MRHVWTIPSLVASLVSLCVGSAIASPPTSINYQGQLKAEGSLFTGTAQMKFAIVDGGVSLWSNDSTSVAGGEPTGAVSIPVTNGLFTVALGSGTMRPLSTAVFSSTTAPLLRVWVNTGGGFEQLTDQALSSAPYALGGGATDALWQKNNLNIHYGAGSVGGSVGIGTGSPAAKLEINGWGAFGTKQLRLNNSNATSSTWDFAIKSNGTSPYLGISADLADILTLRNNGNVGINTATPIKTLDVVGGVIFQGNHLYLRNPASPVTKQTWGFVISSSDGTFSLGNATDVPPSGGSLVKTIIRLDASAPHNSLVIDGTGQASVKVLSITGADVAEHFPVDEDVEPGTVLAIDAAEPGRLRVCQEPMSRDVAGVVSGAGGLHAGVLLGGAPNQGAGVPVALSGRVWVKADASERPIHVGDLLVSASRPGHAAAAKNSARSAGRILGKAMSKLEAGTGMVLVLVSLQ